jgi:hypothetical protein
MSFYGDFVVTINEAELAAILADFYAASNDQRPNDFTPTNPSVINTVNVAIAPPIPTTDNLQPTIEYAQAIVAESVAEFGVQETPLVVTLLETLDDAGDLAGYLTRPVPAFWFGGIQVIMNGLTDAQRTTIGSLDIGSQISVTKSFPNSTPPTVTQIMALEGISHDITPDRHIVTLYPNPSRIYTYFIVGGYTTTTTRTNLLTNPNFEVNTSTYQLVGAGTTISRITSDSYIGNASVQVDVSGLVASAGMGMNAAVYRMPVTAGVPYMLSAWVKVPTGQPSVSLRLRTGEYRADGTQNPAQVSSATVVSDTDGWVRLSFADTPTGGATPTVTMVYRVEISNAPGSARQWLVDAVLFEQSSTLLPYFDGTYADTYTGYTLTSQGWSGTADASTSTATWGLTSSFVGSELNDDTKGLG